MCPDEQVGIRVEKREKACPGSFSESLRCKMLMVGTLVRGCRCAMSWSDLDDLTVVTLTYKILSGLYLRNRKV